MADTLEFKLIDPIAANEHWAAEYTQFDIRAVEIYINGQELAALCKENEILFANSEGRPHHVGDYGHREPEYLYCDLMEEMEEPTEFGVELFCCGGCGESGCWSVCALVSQDDEYVCWQFRHNHRPTWAYPFSFRFAKEAYRKEMEQLEVWAKQSYFKKTDQIK